MNGEDLTPSPGILDNGRVADILDLLDDVELAHFINLELLRVLDVDILVVGHVDVLETAEPVVNQTVLREKKRKEKKRKEKSQKKKTGRERQDKGRPACCPWPP